MFEDDYYEDEKIKRRKGKDDSIWNAIVEFIEDEEKDDKKKFLEVVD